VSIPPYDLDMFWFEMTLTLTLTWLKVKEQKGNYSEYVIRHLKATRGGETREVTHLHYVEFPDRGIPKCVPSLLDMIELMRELQPANSPDAPPLVVHCRHVRLVVRLPVGVCVSK